MIKALHAHIGVGKLRINRDSANLVINKLEDLILVILPHFDKYPCRGGKYISYRRQAFRQVVLLMQNKGYKNLRFLFRSPNKICDFITHGFISILNIAYFTHGTSYRTLETKEEIMKAIKKKFPKITSVIPTYKVELKNNTSTMLDPEYVGAPRSC